MIRRGSGFYTQTRWSCQPVNIRLRRPTGAACAQRLTGSVWKQEGGGRLPVRSRVGGGKTEQPSPLLQRSNKQCVLCWRIFLPPDDDTLQRCKLIRSGCINARRQRRVYMQTLTFQTFFFDECFASCFSSYALICRICSWFMFRCRAADPLRTDV